MLAAEEDVVAEFEAAEEEKERENAVAATQTALETDSEEPQDPMEIMGDDFDEPDDVPAVDMQ